MNPQTADSEENWQKHLDRRQRHTESTDYVVAQGRLGAQIYGNSFSAGDRFHSYARQFETRLAEATAVRPGCRILVFCGTGWAWSLDQLEDFVDFYLTGKHRLDDPFGRMEAHSLEAGRIELLRNISAFAFVKRGMDETTPSQCVMPVRGPRFLALA